MTLKGIKEYRGTDEAKAYEGLIQARVTGGQDFVAANNVSGPAKSYTTSVPVV